MANQPSPLVLLGTLSPGDAFLDPCRPADGVRYVGRPAANDRGKDGRVPTTEGARLPGPMPVLPLSAVVNGATPCCAFGDDPADTAPVVLAYAWILAQNHGESVLDMIDSAATTVLRASDDVAAEDVVQALRESIYADTPLGRYVPQDPRVAQLADVCGAAGLLGSVDSCINAAEPLAMAIATDWMSPGATGVNAVAQRGADIDADAALDLMADGSSDPRESEALGALQAFVSMLLNADRIPHWAVYGATPGCLPDSDVCRFATADEAADEALLWLDVDYDGASDDTDREMVIRNACEAGESVSVPIQPNGLARVYVEFIGAR